MNKKRNDFLFGAGAVIDWGGPSTFCQRDKLTILPERESGEIKNRVCCLTHLIRETGFYSKSGERISNKIFEELKRGGFKEDEINFETIINVIEELIVYYSNFNGETKSSLIACFLQPSEILNDILNFEIPVGEINHGYQLLIPGFPNVDNHSYNKETPEQFFLQLLLVNLLDGIIGHVSKYSYFTDGNPTVVENNFNQGLNDSLYNWIKSISDQNERIRMYTLNYDRLFKIILEHRGLKIFEGFECGASLSAEDEILPDVQRILSDVESSVHYNIHGSAFWSVNARDINQLPSSEFYLKASPDFSSNLWEQPTRQMDKGKNMILTNIITGYQKTGKTSVTPFRQMLSAFDRDCQLADTLFIVGYGFGDEHINESIKTAIIYNSNITIKVIDPNFIENQFNEKLGMDLFSNTHLRFEPKIVSENVHSFFENKVMVYTRKFGDFLSDFLI